MIDEYGFQRMGAEVDGLKQHDVRWKPLAPTDGPPGYPGEPYIPLVVSFAVKSGERRRQGHLDYALSRSFWAQQYPPTPTEEDHQTLWRLVLKECLHDLRLIEGGGQPVALRPNRMPKFLRP